MPPTATVASERGESANGYWELVRAEPPPPLSGLVTDLCGYQETSAAVVRRLEPATSIIPVIISFGESLTIDQPAGADPGGHFRSFSAGLHGGFTVTEYVGDQHGLQFDLTPLGALRIFGVPGSAMADRVVPLEDLAPDLGRSLPDRLATAPGWCERFEILTAALARLAERGPVCDPAVEWAWRQLVRTRGSVRVADLAEGSGWSQRHLTARFRSQLGLTPKALAGILRFEHARSVLTTSDLGLAEVAQRCGYADQSHLNRACRRYADTTPAALAAPAAVPADGAAAHAATSGPAGI